MTRCTVRGLPKPWSAESRRATLAADPTANGIDVSEHGTALPRMTRRRSKCATCPFRAPSVVKPHEEEEIAAMHPSYWPCHEESGDGGWNPIHCRGHADLRAAASKRRAYRYETPARGGGAE